VNIDLTHAVNWHYHNHIPFTIQFIMLYFFSLIILLSHKSLATLVNSHNFFSHMNKLIPNLNTSYNNNNNNILRLFFNNIK